MDLLVAKYQKGATLVALANVFGVHKRTIAANLERRGIKQRQRGLHGDDLAEAINLRANGWTYTRLAKRFKMDVDTVSRTLKVASNCK